MIPALLLSPKVWIGVAFAGLAAFAGVQTLRLSNLKAEVAQAQADAVEQAREVERQKQRSIDAQATELAARLRGVAADRDRIAAELRSRPPRRLPVDPGAAGRCDGASGAELSAPDAQFLAGESARADAIAVRLQACQAYVREIQKQ